MAIDLGDQFFVEKDRNTKYEFLSMFVSMMLPISHGVFFVWIPYYLRTKRNQDSLTHTKYFTMISEVNKLTKTFSVKFLCWKFYFQPSLLIVGAVHFAINCGLAIVQTKDIDYEPQSYVVSKRIGRIGVACIPPILILVAKNDFFSTVSGLSLEKSVFFHKWLGRFMFIAITVHMYLSLKYWLDLKFYIMIQIPPQIFGMISYGCLGFLNLASFKFIRNFAFDFFLAQHRVFNFIMLLLAFFHSTGNRAAVLVGVHMLVLDRIVGRVLGLVHKYRGPTKGKSEFEILDEDTIRVSIPIEKSSADPDNWYWFLVPRYGQWKAGQHVLLNVPSVSIFQYHPFTICSLSSSGKMVILMKVRKGFTKKLLKKLHKKMDADEEGTSDVSSPSLDSVRSETKLMKDNDSFSTESSPASSSVSRFRAVLQSFEQPQIVKLKAGINGPFGAKFQPLTKFESVLLFSAGSGSAFTLPVALDLLQKIKALDDADDYLYRPYSTEVTIVVCFKKLANVQWFDHLWHHFLPFLSSGKAHLKLHITQEDPQLQPPSRVDEKKNDLEVTEKTIQMCSTSIENAPGVSIIYGRPDMDDIIVSSAQLLCDANYRKALACLGCGPGEFNHILSKACRTSRKLPSAPDVYCYTESFDS